MDWEAFGRELGTVRETGEHGSTADAQRALTRILGEQAILDGIEHYVALRPGFELFRCILMLLRPPLAMERCRQIYAQDTDP